jgi:DNA mismatch endonuclease (patch repair protein)
MQFGSGVVTPDIVFPRAKLAVFVDGCYWHRCPQHVRLPTRNVDYWTAKLQGNVDRDRRVNALLHDHSWSVLRIWEHEDVDQAADRVESEWRSRRSESP